MVEGAIGEEVIVKNHRPKVADCRFLIGCVERDLRTKIAAMDNANMVLWAAKVTGILECDPWVACLKNHLEHRLPEIQRIHLPSENLTTRCRRFIFFVAYCEGSTIEVV